MKRFIIHFILVCAIFMVAAPAMAASLQSVNNNAFILGSKSAHSLNIQFVLPEYQLAQESVNGTIYQKIKLENAGYFIDAGAPELPFITTTVAIPNHGQVSLEVLSTHEQTISHFFPYPAQDDDYAENGRGFTINQAIYQSGQVYPREAILNSEPQILRDFRIITIQVQPFVWDSATNQLIVKDQMDIRLNYTDEPGINEINEPLHISPAFDKIYQSMILNYADFRPDERLIAQTPPRIVIVHGNYNDTTYIQKINEFALWKRQKGADVRLVNTATTGNTTTAIKAYLQGLYDDINSRPDFIIIVGDVSGTFLVPSYTYPSEEYGRTDYPFQMLAGDDLLGDCFLGRISAENVSQLNVLFAKIYAYEKNMNMANAGYLNRMLIVSDSQHDGISVIYLGRYIQELSLVCNPDYTYTTLLQSGPSPNAMNTAMNDGVGFFYYRGYIGMSGWSPSENLVNINKLVHAVIITCSTGNYEGTSTAESFTRLGTAAVPKGAITAIGESTSGNHTMPNNCITGAIADGIYARGMRTMGEALLHGKLYVSTMYETTQPVMASRVTHWCNLMGDPTVEVYITIPRTFAIDATDLLPLGANSLNFNVEDDDGVAVSNACVTISQGDTILARSFTDEAGFVLLSFNAELTDTTAFITVSKHDFKPLQQIVTVDSTGYLVAGVSQYDDDDEGNSIGNSNYSPNSGERLEVQFSVKNTTNTWIRNVSGYVTSDSPYATVVDSLVAFGDVLSGHTESSMIQALIDISPSCPSNTYLRLTMHLTDRLGVQYLVPTEILVTDAVLNFVSCQVVDTNNQALDPNETATLNVTVVNNGSIDISNVSGRLYSLNNMVMVYNVIADFGNIAVNGQATCTANAFQIHGGADMLPGMRIPMRVKLTNPAGFLQWIDFILDVGEVTVASPLGPDDYGYVIYDNGDISYPECPFFSWFPIAPAEGGMGTQLTLNDPSTGTEGDAVGNVSLATVNLPFTFQFYGVDYTQITVCTNGFLVMGITQDACFRNYRLPGAVGPGAMIAPFWDDLATGTGSGVYTFYYALNHCFIVEWYHMLNGYNTTYQETFQVILYDPAFYPTSLGDGPIQIQYYTFNNVDNGTGTQESGCYSTIGIQDQYHQRGLEYSFNNTYPTAARPLANNRCFYITNVPVHIGQPELDMGAIQIADNNGNGVLEPGETIDLNVQLENIGDADIGTIAATLSATDTYVEITNASVTYPAIEAGDSAYSLTPFILQISPNCPGNRAINFTLNVISEDITVQYHFTLVVEKPEISLASFYINDISSNNNGIPEPNEDFLLILNLTNLSPAVAENIAVNLTTTNPNVSISNATQIRPWLHLNEKVQLVFPVHFGVIATGTIIPFTLHHVAENAFPGSWNLNLICDVGPPDGSGIISGIVTMSDATDPSRVLLTTDNHFYAHPDADGSYTFYFPSGVYNLTAALQYYYNEPVPAVTITATDLTHVVSVTMAFLANPTGLVVSGVETQTVATLTWVAPDNPVYPVVNYRINRMFENGEYAVIAEPTTTTYSDDLSDLDEGTYTYYVTSIYAVGEGAPCNTYTIAYPFVINPDEEMPGIVNALYSNFPNPFNPTTSMSFSLAKSGNFSLKIYNTKGQLIKTLIDETKAAGMHRVVWNGDDNAGKPVSSGIYLYKVQSGKFTSTRKMMMLK